MPSAHLFPSHNTERTDSPLHLIHLLRRCHRSRHYYITPPLNFCSEKEDGALSGCVTLHYWFIVARRLGLHHSLSPHRRCCSNNTSLPPTQDPLLSKPRKPPDKFYRSLILLSTYLLAIFTSAAAVSSGRKPLQHFMRASSHPNLNSCGCNFAIRATRFQ
jgi:hypothetical protein